MGRQLFLHHYLPAHLASALVTGSVVEFLFSTDSAEPDYHPGKSGKKVAPTTKRRLSARERLAGQSMAGAWIATAVIMALVAFGWYYFLPLTYGYPGLTAPEVNRRKWLAYDLHFAK